MVTFDGDSQTQHGDTLGQDIPSLVRNDIPAKRIYNMALSGDTLLEMNAGAEAGAIDATLTHATNSVLVAWGGTNDLYEGATGSTAYSRLTTYCNGRRAAGWDRIVVCNLIPQAKTGSPAGYETQRQAFNSLLAAGWADICDAVVDLAADTRLQDPFNTTYFDPDHLHIILAGRQVVAGLVEPVLLALGVDGAGA